MDSQPKPTAAPTPAPKVKVTPQKGTTPPPTMKGPSAGASFGAGDLLQNPMFFSVIVAVVLVLLTILYLWNRKGRKGRSILFVGPCEAGKTAIYSKILCGDDIDTVTSVVPNECDYIPMSGKPALLLKDLPGHERVRVKFWDTHKVGVRGIVCVIDAAGGSKSIREGAEVLYGILTDPVVNSVQPNILILANKQDLPTAKSTKVIRTQLEREITTLRMTRSATLQAIGDNRQSTTKTLGRMDRDFEFDHVAPIKVDFAQGCGIGEESDLKSVIAWLDHVA